MQQLNLRELLFRLKLQVMFFLFAPVVLQVLLQYGMQYGCTFLMDFISFCYNIIFPSRKTVIKASLIWSSLFCLQCFY